MSSSNRLVERDVTAEQAKQRAKQAGGVVVEDREKLRESQHGGEPMLVPRTRGLA